MTGTAETEASEFANTYELPVVPIPTNKPMVRADNPDLIYKSEDAKFAAVVDDIDERHAAGQPVLVGTASVSKSEHLSRLLEKRGIPHEVLNAKQHFREAEIVAQAGRVGAVTVATNMAGRGVDIILGGNPEGLAVREAIGPGHRPVHRRGQGRSWKAVEAEFETSLRTGGRRGPCPRRPLRARAASATRAAASTTSCGAGRAGRGTRARAGSSSRSRTTSCGCSPPAP